MTTTEQINDTKYEDTTIASVEPESDGWGITRDDGWSFYVPNKYGVEPKVGERVRFYGDGIGRPVRGLAIDGRVLYYRTEDEERAKFEREMAEMDAKRRQDFEENRAEHDARIAALPLAFQRRLAKFQQTDPDWRWRHEGYELFTCEQAVLIAETLKSPEAVVEFQKADWADQQALVPGLSDGHSGNTFGMACRLAVWYLQRPALVILEHGTLTLLEGCERFGCPHPVPADLLDGFDVPV